jgi:hypothetical protein
MAGTPELRELVGRVILESIGAERDPLRQLADAERLAAELAGLGDRLVGYFVEQARAEGHSWAEIGARKGFTRQAAQQRYAPYISRLTLDDLAAAGTLARFGPRARQCLRAAEGYAEDALGTEHLLLAILDDTDSVAVRTLTALHAPPDVLRPELPAPKPAAEPKALTHDARRAVDAAAAEAADAGHEVSSAHLLLGILRNPASPAGKLLTRHGVTAVAAAQQIRERLSHYLQGGP